MSGRHHDIWGYCQSCRRWFSCPRWFDKQAGDPLCPVCLSEPSAIENRALLTEPRSESPACCAQPRDLRVTADTRWRPANR